MNTKIERSKEGLSQMRLAQRSGVSRFRISLAESGYLKLTPEEVAKIKTALGKVTSNV